MGSLSSCFATQNNENAEQDRPRFESVPHTEGAPTDKKWFHAHISHREAERRLQTSGGDDGSYLVYTDPSRDGSYVLLVLYKGKDYRWKINRRINDGLYVLGDHLEGGKGYANVKDLIKDHRGKTGKPIKTRDGLNITLSKSYIYVDN